MEENKRMIDNEREFYQFTRKLVERGSITQEEKDAMDYYLCGILDYLNDGDEDL